MSQASRVLAALKAGAELTPADAVSLWRIYRLGAVVFDLRRAGHPIVDLNIENGKRTERFSRYALAKE